MDQRKSSASEARSSISSSNRENNHRIYESDQGIWYGLGAFQSETKPGKRSIGVGDEPACSSLRRNSWQCFRKKLEENRLERNEELNKAERIEKFVAALQREGNVVQKEVCASAIASTVSTMISHPFNVVTAKYLLLRYDQKEQSFYLGRPRISYIIQNILKTKGWLGFYKGYYAAQRESLAYVISMFLTYRKASEFAKHFDCLRDRPSIVRFSAGFISAIIPVMVLYPLSAYKAQRRSIASSTLKLDPIYRRKISLSIFNGCFSLFLHMGTQFGLRFLFYKKIQDKMMAVSPTHEKATSTSPYVSAVNSILILSHFQLVLAGGIAVILSELITYPFSIVYARLMMSTLRRQQHKFEHTCRGVGQCFRAILKTEGVLALYAGVLPNTIRSMLSVALQFAVYDKAKNWLRPILPT